jgi:hypothetical protein
MKPVNVKSMFSLLCVYMEKLDAGEIDANQANAMGKLVAQAENLLTYELKRAALLSNEGFIKNFRNIETKVFDSIPENFQNIDKTDDLVRQINNLHTELKELKSGVGIKNE